MHDVQHAAHIVAHITATIAQHQVLHNHFFGLQVASTSLAILLHYSRTMAFSDASCAAPGHGQQVVGSAAASHGQQVVRYASRIAMYLEPEMRQDPTQIYDAITFEPAVPPWQAQLPPLRHNDNHIIAELRKLQIDMAALQHQQAKLFSV